MKLNYKRYGDGENVLIILHGLFGMLDNWATLSKKFAESYTVYAVDQRNHGKSEHAEAFSYDLLAKDLLEFMDAHDIYTANLLGHSMGGKTVMEFTRQFPERVERLIVADIAPRRYDAKHSTIIEALTQLPLAEVKSRGDADQFLAQKIEQPGVRQFLLKNIQRTESGYSLKMNLPSLVANYSDIIGSVDLGTDFDRPVLVLSGGASDYVQEADKEHFEEHYNNVAFQQISGAGHWLHADSPMAFFEAVSGFLEKPLY